MNRHIQKILKGKKVVLKVKDKSLEEKIKDIVDERGEGERIYITDVQSENDIYVYRFSIGNLIRFIKNLERSYIYKGLVFELPERLVNTNIEKSYMILFFIILYTILIAKIGSLVPTDDLLRHLVSYRFNYDYSNIFVHTGLPKWNMHFPYEWLVGHIHQVFSIFSNETVHTLVSVAFIDIVIITLLSIGIRLTIKEKSPIVYILTLSLIISQISGRLLLGRPTTLVISLFILSIGLYLSGRKSLSLLVSTIMSVMYYLYFIYMIPLAIYLRKSVIVPFSIGFLFWFTYAYLKGGNYVVDIYRYIISLDLDKIPITENASILSVISAPIFIFMLILIILYWKRVRKEHFYSSLFFYLSNQIRYIEVIVPLTVISIVDLIEEFYKKILKQKRLYAFLLSVSMILGGFNLESKNPIFDKDICKLIEGKSVFTLPGDNFRLIYNCSGYNIKLSPAMEPRWSDRIYMDVYSDITQDYRLSCENENLYKYEYIYESVLKGRYSCLKLEYVDGEYRLWKVIFPLKINKDKQ